MVCKSCEGTGVVRDSQGSNGDYKFGKVKCETCSGTGNFPAKISTDELQEQANLKYACWCERVDCNYGLDSAPMIEIVFKLSIDGGYLSSCIDDDGEINGWSSKCPLCHEDTLALSS